MKYIATKNKFKFDDSGKVKDGMEKHPDFKIYKEGSDGKIIEEEYTKKDQTKGTGWKSFGAIWITVENGKIKSMSISIDNEAVSSYDADAELDKLANLRPEDVPF